MLQIIIVIFCKKKEINFVFHFFLTLKIVVDEKISFVNFYDAS